MTGKFLAFGEIMLRLSPPGRELLMQSARFDVWVAGAEANVATQLARLGHDVGFASRVPDNDLGRAAIDTLRGHGVDVATSRPAASGWGCISSPPARGCARPRSSMIAPGRPSRKPPPMPGTGTRSWRASTGCICRASPRRWGRCPPRPPSRRPRRRPRAASPCRSTAIGAASSGRAGTAIRARSCAASSNRPT